MVAINLPTSRELSLRRIAQRVVVTLFSLIAGINLTALVLDNTPNIRTHLAAAVMAVYLAIEALRFLRRTDAMGLLTPAFLSLFAHFMMSYLGVITLSVFDPWAIQYFERWLPDLDAALAGTILLAMLAAFSMMRAYEFAQPMARRLRRTAHGWRALRREIRPAMTLAIIMQFVFVGLVGLALNLGVYGVTGDFEDKARFADIVQYVRLAIAAGTLSYFLILLRYFHQRASGQASVLFGAFCVTLIVLHVIAGTLSGFKTQMVFPFIVAALAHFLAARRIPKAFLFMAVIALIGSYSVIEPFRSYLNLMGDNRPRGVIEAVMAVATAYNMRDQFVRNNDISRGETIVSRFDLSGMTSTGVEFVRRGDLQPELRQDLQDSILLAPLLAYVPRAVWHSKPSYAPGVWFNQTVLGRWHDTGTSVGMGPIAYLYMAGGVLMVCLGFALWGVIGALLFDGLARSGAGGLIIFLSVAFQLVIIPTAFGPVVTGILRMVIVAFVAQWILLRPSRRRAMS